MADSELKERGKGINMSSSIDYLSPASFWTPQHMLISAWLEHVPFAFWLVGATQPRVFVELGTLFGESYFAFCQAVEKFGFPTACYAVDTWKGDEHTGWYAEDVYALASLINERSYSQFSRLIRSTFDEALPHFEDKQIDLLHIDGRHRYEDALHDFTTWKPKLSEKAVVLFHDINVRERDFGVHKLWQELKEAYPSFEFLHGHGLGVLAVGPAAPPLIHPLLEKGPRQSAIRESYAKLGLLVSQQFRFDRVEADLAARDKNLAELREELLRREAIAAQLEATAADGRAEWARAQEALAKTRAQVEEQSRALAVRDQTLASAQAELGSRDRKISELHTELTTVSSQLQLIFASTSWRVIRIAQTVFSRLPPRARLMARRVVKTMRWIITPHKIPARLKNLRARRAQSRSKNLLSGMN
jgi:hypothetical protein